MNIAIIPARSGSKRIPKKNIKEFCGKPIISYPISIALNSGIFDKVIVSTDCQEIAKISEEYGAEVPFLREKNLSDDFSNTHEVIGSVVNKLLDKFQLKLKYVCCIYATSSLMQQGDLLKGFNLIKSNKWEVVFSATKFSYPIMRSFKLNKDLGIEMFFPKFFFKRSQDLDEAYHDAGQFYWSHYSYWLGPQKKYNSLNTIVLIPSWRAQDIDNLEDWNRAEKIYKSIDEK